MGVPRVIINIQEKHGDTFWYHKLQLVVITLLTLIWATFLPMTSHFCKAGCSVVTVIESKKHVKSVKNTK